MEYLWWMDTGAEFLFVIYRLEMALAVVSLLINLLISTYAFSGDSFSPHTAMFRTILVIDVFTDVGYILDAFSALLHQEPLLQEIDGGSHLSKLQDFVAISDCSIYRPYLFYC
uniref:Uncharacterized protein n=1 Tax=Ditylenchus dipsaci TaxID=166011 RepID=A0A915DBH1_9BILA